MPKNIWVLAEIIGGEEVSKLSLGLLTEARDIAGKVNGTVTALVLADQYHDYSGILGRYGVSRTYFFHDPLFKYFSSEAYAAALVPELQADKPWLFLMGHTPAGRELGPRLAALLETGIVTNCVRLDLSDTERPRFFRPVYGGQLHQEVVFQTGGTMLLTMDPEVFNISPVKEPGKVETRILEPKLTPETVQTRHLGYLPADFKSVDVSEADTIVSVGMGAVTDELLPLVKELAEIIEGSIGATRPVVDEGKITKERMIGQTGKVVSPEFYLALGVSGASHHVGGIQDSGRIISVNRDSQAPIVFSSDVGIVADLREILPRLIERIKRAKSNGQII